MTIIRRGDTFHLRKRVPLRFASVEERPIIGVSLRTDSESAARRKAEEVWAHLIEGWESALRGEGGNARARYDAAKDIAARRGFSFMAAPAVADLPISELVARLQAVPLKADGVPNQRVADAVLGGVEKPVLTVREALDEFWKITIDQTRGKTPDQIRRWQNPRKKAVENFIKVIGNKALNAITHDDGRKWRDWWNARIDKEGLSGNSAHKDFTHVAHTLKVVNDALGLNLVLPLSKLTIKATPKGQRKAFSVAWVRDEILAPGALDGLNEQARAIVLACINTGARPSEIAGLMKHHIHLGGDIPFIEIKPEGRELKNAASARRIPLVGVSLDGMKAWMAVAPKGDKAFPIYFGRDLISATVNKYLRENGLIETPEHTLYGLRHGFEDRMTAAEPAWPERMKCDVFGHTLSRQRYGDGATLEHIHRRLSEIAL